MGWQGVGKKKEGRWRVVVREIRRGEKNKTNETGKAR